MISKLGSPVGEIVVAAVGLAMLGAIAFLPYVHRGGFTYDDWQEQAIAQLHGFSALFNSIIDTTPRRPLGALYFSIVHTILGGHEHMHLALAAGLRLVASLALFAVLRQLRLDRVSAGAAAGLALLFPYSDATWLWATGAQMSLSVICWLLGLLLGLRGLRSGTRMWIWQTLACVLYAASILIYEDTLIVVVLSGALYVGRAPRRVVLGAWAASVGAAALAFLLFTSRWVQLAGGSDTHGELGIHDTLKHARAIANQGLSLAATSLVPFGAPGRWAVAIGVILLAAVAGLVAWRTADIPLRRELIQWLAAGVAGVIVAIGGWAMLARADPYYSPLQAGIGNRINVVAGIGLAVLSVGIIRLGTTLALSSLPRDRRVVSAALTVAVATGIGGSYLHRIGSDRGDWWRARRLQGAVLADLRAVGRPPQGTTVIARGFPLFSAPGVPVFAASWDLDGALKLLWQDPTVRGLPAPPAGISCDSTGVNIAGVTTEPVPYGHTLVVDVGSRRVSRVGTILQCRRLTPAG